VNAIALSFDIEWAADEVVEDVLRLLSERSLRASFFCTHHGIEVPGHERGIHPNFDRNGNTQVADADKLLDEAEFCRAVIRANKAFCPEATGVRSHRLIFDTLVEQACREGGLQYASTTMRPLAASLAPGSLGRGLVSLPIYFMDHWDLQNQVTGFDLARLQLGEPGMKVFDFHPLLIFLNAANNRQYEESKSYYRDPDRLRAARYPGRGIRTLFINLLDELAKFPAEVRLLSEINSEVRCG
jgi:polysaccharide deactylase WbmS-like protein